MNFNHDKHSESRASCMAAHSPLPVHSESIASCMAAHSPLPGPSRRRDVFWDYAIIPAIHDQEYWTCVG